MELDLVHHGRDVCVHELPQVVGVEVGDADGPDASLLVELHHGPPGLLVDACGLGAELSLVGRPVDEVEVEVVEAEVLEAALEGGLGALVSALGVPELACHEELVAGDA